MPRALLSFERIRRYKYFLDRFFRPSHYSRRSTCNPCAVNRDTTPPVSFVIPVAICRVRFRIGADSTLPALYFRSSSVHFLSFSVSPCFRSRYWFCLDEKRPGSASNSGIRGRIVASSSDANDPTREDLKKKKRKKAEANCRKSSAG